MEYISTRNTKKTFSFKDVFLKGLAPDGGLFVPKKIPLYSSQELEKLKSLSYNELAAKIIFKYPSFFNCLIIALPTNPLWPAT